MNCNTDNLHGLFKAASVAMAASRPSSTTNGSGVGSVGTNAAVVKRQPNPLPGPIEKENPGPAAPTIEQTGSHGQQKVASLLSSLLSK